MAGTLDYRHNYLMGNRPAPYGNPLSGAHWGLIVVGGLVAGSLGYVAYAKLKTPSKVSKLPPPPVSNPRAHGYRKMYSPAA